MAPSFADFTPPSITASLQRALHLWKRLSAAMIECEFTVPSPLALSRTSVDVATTNASRTAASASPLASSSINTGSGGIGNVDSMMCTSDTSFGESEYRVSGIGFCIAR